jgi:putative phage-type endonuclease
MNKQQWLKEKEKGISGTDAASIMDLNPYMTKLELWEYKTGKKVREEIENEYMHYGKDAEKYLIDLFRLDFLHHVVQVPQEYTLQKNKDYPFIIGTVDANIFTSEKCNIEIPFNNLYSNLKRGFLEIKTANVFKKETWEKWAERIPDNYYVQILHYFLLDEKYEYCYVKAQLKSNFKDLGLRLDTRHYYFERKDLEKDLALLKEKEIEFWEENVKKNIKPKE